MEKEKKLLAHLLAGVADVLNAPGAKELVASLSRKLSDIICERSLNIETSLALLSLLEELSAWSVSILKTDVLKGTLELKAVELKVGKIPDFVDPYVVADELLHHSNLVKNQSDIVLPPSPPPDSPDVYSHHHDNHNNNTVPVAVGMTAPLPPESPVSSLRTLSSSSSGILDDDYLTPPEAVEACKQKYSTQIPQGQKQLNDENACIKIDIAAHKLPLITDTVKRYISDLSSSTVCVALADGMGSVTIEGFLKDCKRASKEVEKILSNISVQEGKRYVLPDWMEGPGFTKKIQDIANEEGCTVEELIDARNNRAYVFIQSERSWNIRRCIEKLQKFEAQYEKVPNNFEGSKANTNRIRYNRGQLLMLRDSITSHDDELIKGLTRQCLNLDLLANH